ncbi:DUF5683 domain-containing protein [bacterium]|nr:DUF5683 domain-containing protein [bacterium]
MDLVGVSHTEAYAFPPATQQAREDSSRSESPKTKSPKGAFFRSLAIPGWGQWYAEQKIKSVLAFSTEVFLIGLSIHYNKRADESTDTESRAFYQDKRNQTYWFMLGFALLSGVDAYIDAHLHDFDTGPDLSLRLGPIPNANQRPAHAPTFGLSLKARF